MATTPILPASTPGDFHLGRITSIVAAAGTSQQHFAARPPAHIRLRTTARNLLAFAWRTADNNIHKQISTFSGQASWVMLNSFLRPRRQRKTCRKADRAREFVYRLSFEWLEPRQMLSGVAQADGPEFQVNTYTTGDQNLPKVASDAAGDYVIAYQSDDDGSGVGIFAERYSAAGLAEGSEFQVNTYTTGNQLFPSVAMDSVGDFVVTWESPEDGSDTGIYAQRYNAAGVAQGSEFQVNTYTTGHQDSPSVGMDSAGDFVIAWSSYGDGGGYGVYAQRYNTTGAAQGSQFQVNTYTTGNQGQPAVAMDLAGAFVIVWTSASEDGSDTGVYGQEYASAGAAGE